MNVENALVTLHFNSRVKSLSIRGNHFSRVNHGKLSRNPLGKSANMPQRVLRSTTRIDDGFFFIRLLRVYYTMFTDEVFFTKLLTGNCVHDDDPS